MEPPIQYVQTKDGVSIAYYAIGQGPAILSLMSPWSHLEAEWQIESLRMTYSAAAQMATFVRLDPRGFGLSDRDPQDFKVENLLLDIEAVVDRLGLEKFGIYALGMSSMVALLYAARYPDKVTHLVQNPPAVCWDDMDYLRLDKILELMIADWELGTETFLRTLNPDFPDQMVQDFARLLRTSIDPDSFVRLWEAARNWDVSAEAGSVSAPTLLIHLRNNPNFDPARTRRVAGMIGDSRVGFVKSGFEGPMLAQRFFQGLDLDLESPAEPPASPSPPSTFRTVLFTDIVGHTEMMSRLGDERGREVLREHERITREVLKAHGGTEVKTMGDGFMASFGSVTKAVECAIALQRAFVEREGEPLSVRVGLNAGEPIEEDGDLFGATVILASRIAAKAEGGEILVADTVRGLCSGKGFAFGDRGEFVAKGIEDPVRVYEVSWRE